ncbi:MAG: class I SAM-dependent methyltransferase [Phycisphaerales bacterium]
MSRALAEQPHATTDSLAQALGTLDDAALVATLEAALEVRRSGPLIKAPRDRLVREIALTRELDDVVQKHLNIAGAKCYRGRHPKHWLWRSHKQWILDRVAAGQRVLDVGCGASAYLGWMAEKGCLVTACDMNPVRIEQARSIMSHENLRFEVRDVTREAPSTRHDVVICSHVIEHLDEPVGLLRALGRCAPRLLVAVPPVDSRWQKVMYRDLGLRWKDDEDHRREYTPESLREEVTRAGWAIDELHAGIDIKASAHWVGDAGAGPATGDA